MSSFSLSQLQELEAKLEDKVVALRAEIDAKERAEHEWVEGQLTEVRQTMQELVIQKGEELSATSEAAVEALLISAVEEHASLEERLNQYVQESDRLKDRLETLMRQVGDFGVREQAEGLAAAVAQIGELKTALEEFKTPDGRVGLLKALTGVHSSRLCSRLSRMSGLS